MNSDKLQQLLDRTAIRELTARYNRAVDDGDAESFAKTFVADGILSVEGAAYFRGRDELSTFVVSLGYGSIHMTMDAIIEIDRDEAWQQCSVLVTMREQKKEHICVVTTARSDDRLVRTPEGWRFALRTMQADLDMAKVFARFASKSAAYDALTRESKVNCLQPGSSGP
jgi:uncharacterized protein (TIGR02246 family)